MPKLQKSNLKRSAPRSLPLVIGQPVTNRGIPFSELTSDGRTVTLNLIPDFLRDTSGTPVKLNAARAIEAVTILNGGVICGNGYEEAIKQSVARGEFKDGTLILARRSDLEKLGREHGTNPALGKMKEIIYTVSYFGSLCVSSTKCPHDKSGFHKKPHVYSVTIADGDNTGCVPLDASPPESQVVVLRGFNCG